METAPNVDRITGRRGTVSLLVGIAWRTPFIILWLALTGWCATAIALAPRGPDAVTWSLASLFAFACVQVTLGPLPGWWRTRGARWATLVAMWAAVIGWFWFVPAPADADWQPDVRESPTFHFHGDELTVSGIRNFRYRTSDTDFEEVWTERTYDMTRLRTVDLFFSFWGPKLICHNFVSFGFERTDGAMEQVVVSIEARKRRGQEYSAIGGLFRQFPLIYVWADERDVVRVRTDFRGETVRRYRVEGRPENLRILLERFAIESSELAHAPRWYNAVTQSCGIDILRTAWGQRIPLIPSAKLLFNGTWERDAWDEGRMGEGLRFEEALQRADITADARAADIRDFSRAIRQREVTMRMAPPAAPAASSPTP
jgi:hypothetical protein